MDLDISPELVVFREYGNDRDLNIIVLNTVMSVRNDAPFWSGQMSAKNLRSSPGRWLSIGTQYLKISPSVVVIVNNRESKPYRMQSTIQSRFSTPASNEFLQNPEFLRAT